MKAIRLNGKVFWQQWLGHALLVWLVVNLLDAADFLYKTATYGPYLVQPGGIGVTLWKRFSRHNIEQASGLVILLVTLLVEVNYQWVFRQRSLKIFLGTTLATGVAGCLMIRLLNQWVNGVTSRPLFLPELVLLLAAYALVYALLRDFIGRRINQAQQRYEHSKAQLSALRAQLHPHFFFNSLNTIYGTALEENATRTAESITGLSHLLRYLMSEQHQEFVSLSDELGFLEDYLRLQRLRIPERKNIHLETELHYDGQPAQIAPLLLIPFVENAFRYGVSVDRPCYIKLNVVARNGQLKMVVENQLLPNLSLEKGQGTGIENTRKRLAIVYPNRHQLFIQQQDNCYKIILQLDLT